MEGSGTGLAGPTLLPPLVQNPSEKEIGVRSLLTMNSIRSPGGMAFVQSIDTIFDIAVITPPAPGGSIVIIGS